MKEKNLLERAREFAEESHKGQCRYNKITPYITHPITVANRLSTEFKQSKEVIAAGFLHDVVEDCGISLKQIVEEFGNEVAFLVDGLTKVVSVDGKNNDDATYRKLLAYGYKDPRVLLIKLCDVAHNSSCLDDFEAEKLKRFTRKSLSFYVPLAKAIGFENLANEITELNMKYRTNKPEKILWNYIVSREDIERVHVYFHGYEELS